MDPLGVEGRSAMAFRGCAQRSAREVDGGLLAKGREDPTGRRRGGGACNHRGAPTGKDDVWRLRGRSGPIKRLHGGYLLLHERA